ncbi:pantoate--beta-alanine ligase [Saccharophagus sp. K07]|jgi:pantoate--beta-alanine ligase|uniref:pantoate--beta-alanine ligase n=1 Tax=Saccharophagus sp. K07 TaxID=2283636 RepID=UPI0016525A85|nr:pantoate--beta-alanine ligase [Saccharophagus sp. K07]MBC6904296.1 pantoate--beta-alanine ligase [Saccharophagus sp. K07]
MQIFHHIQSVRQELQSQRKQGKRIGFVPTMGNLHDAHLALVKQARENADVVIASIFVNRLQFGLNEDWDKYPRTLEADIAKLRSVGCDYLFCPEEQEIYPNGMDTQTRVIVPTMADILCGASRPGHFEGVTTVVTKLFNIVQPDVAVFGLKDYQQLAIIRRMVQDLCIPVEILAGDIVRESDGLAMSSRNGYLTPEERPKVNQLYLTLTWVAERIRAGEKNFAELEQQAKKKISTVGFRPDYVTICNSRTLAPAAHDDDEITVLGAMYTQGARLIDNVSLSLGNLTAET